MENPVLELLGSEFDCRCGRRHLVPVKDVAVEGGLLPQVPERLQRLGLPRRVLLVADMNTMAAAGEQLHEYLIRSGFIVGIYEYKVPFLEPEEEAVSGLDGAARDYPWLLAVGSGTLNDLAKYVSFSQEKPYVIVGTAPSMDGWVSPGAPLIRRGFKKTIPCRPPQAVYGDLDILCRAPREMIAAGYGDLLGKLTSNADWLLGKLLFEEYRCPLAWEIIEQAVNRCLSSTEGIAKADPQAIATLMWGLINSGIAMLLVESSRPASGGEHILSHYWEMKSFAEGKRPALHGNQVGYGTVLMIRIFSALLSLTDENLQRPSGCGQDTDTDPDRAKWEERMRSLYGQAAPSVIKEGSCKVLSSQEHEEQIRLLKRHWPDIKGIISQFVGDGETIIKRLQEAGVPVSKESLHLPENYILEALRYARFLRSRYTGLDMAAEVGLLDDSFLRELIS